MGKAVSRGLPTRHFEFIQRCVCKDDPPQYVVVVAENHFDPHEAKKSSAIIPPDNTAKTPRKLLSGLLAGN